MKKIIMIFIVSFFVFLQAGCSRSEDTIYLENTISETETESARKGTDPGQETKPGQEVKPGQETAAGQETAPAQETDPGQEAKPAEVCYVYVCGAVENPGVYTLPTDSRVYEAIALAGGLLDTAGVDVINQAEQIHDGQMLRIPTKEEAEAQKDAGDFRIDTPENGQENASDGRVNINTASAAELMTLSGIGQAKADALIAYRTKNGDFSTVEEIMNVEGIKEGVYNRIKDNIRVK